MPKGVYLRSEEAKKKISEGLTGRELSPAHRQHIGEGLVGNQNATGSRRTIAMKKRSSNIIKVALRRPEVKERMREAAKRRWSDPAKRLEQRRRIKRAKRLKREKQKREQS